MKYKSTDKNTKGPKHLKSIFIKCFPKNENLPIIQIFDIKTISLILIKTIY